jgi:hypothetical protein
MPVPRFLFFSREKKYMMKLYLHNLRLLLLLCAIASIPPAVAAAAEQAGQAGRLAVPDHGAYTGAYIDFGEGEDKVTLEALEKFEKLVGKHQAIIAIGNFWGERAFSLRNAQIISGYGAIPLIFWSPWDRPYDEDKLPDAFNLYNILNGMCDKYIDQWADSVKEYGKPLLVAWGIEMNGTWFPWSGYFYGGGQENVNTEEREPIGPETYKKAYRYVIDRVRARGVKNVQWVFQVNNGAWPDADWNDFASYYPGSDYVDWLGVSVYGKVSNAWGEWASFADVFDNVFEEMTKLDPTKPIMVAEWGVGEYPKHGDKAKWFTEAFSDLQGRFSRVKAAVYWHERWQNADESYSNLRVNSSPEALAAYRNGVKSPYWLGQPHFQPQK